MVAKRSPRKPAKQERSRALVAAVATATEDLVREHGLSGVTIAMIARRSGVSPASVYEYFPSKDAVMAAWAEATWERALAAGFAALEQAIVVQKLPVDEGMARVVVAFNQALRVFARACVGQSLENMVGRGARRVELIDGVRMIIESIVTAVPDVTAIRVRSAPLAARLLASVITSDAYMDFLSRAEDDQAADTEVADLFRRYLRGDVAQPCLRCNNT